MPVSQVFVETGFGDGDAVIPIYSPTASGDEPGMSGAEQDSKGPLRPVQLGGAAPPSHGAERRTAHPDCLGPSRLHLPSSQ